MALPLYLLEIIASATLRDQCRQHRIDGHHHVPGSRPSNYIPHSRFLIHPMNWYFSQKSVDHQRLREYLSSLDNDLARYVQIFAQETAEAPPGWTFSTACRRRKSHRRPRIHGLRHRSRDAANGVRRRCQTLESQWWMRRARQTRRRDVALACHSVRRAGMVLSRSSGLMWPTTD